VPDILAAIEAAIAPASAGPLAGRKILITAGPTTTPIDAVRYITNHSTGRMGAAMAEAALRRGAELHYVLGIDKGVVRPVAPAGAETRLHLTEVRTAEEMAAAALKALPLCDGVIATAAVMDYRVAAPAAGKLKRSSAATSLDMVPSTDVLQTLRDAARPGQWFFGFAAETDDVEENGRLKLERKRLDFLFANPVARAGETADTGFSVATNGGVLLRREGGPVPLPVMDKAALADALLDHVA
jgi:phosphopantothenoylcysteine decarboxylase/phosphopantothenate--cysteine ligase